MTLLEHGELNGKVVVVKNATTTKHGTFSNFGSKNCGQKTRLKSLFRRV